MGFSTRTCLPAAAAAMVCSACSLSGVAITTASRSGSDRKCFRSSKAGAGEAALCSCAKRTAFALSRLSTLHNVAPSTSPMAGVSASRLMLPVPIIPSRNMVYPQSAKRRFYPRASHLQYGHNKPSTITARTIPDQCQIWFDRW